MLAYDQLRDPEFQRDGAVDVDGKIITCRKLGRLFRQNRKGIEWSVGGVAVLAALTPTKDIALCRIPGRKAVFYQYAENQPDGFRQENEQRLPKRVMAYPVLLLQLTRLLRLPNRAFMAVGTADGFSRQF